MVEPEIQSGSPDRSPTTPTDGRRTGFAAFVRAVARGASLSEPLDEDRAQDAMAMILDGRAEPVQVGAFLAVLRYRKETAPELAGFVRAARALLPDLSGLSVDLDWPSYADRHRQLPYFVLSAMLLARAGVRVLIHGLAGEGAATTPAVMVRLGIASATSATGLEPVLRRQGIAYAPIEQLSPPLARLFALRPVLGVRTAANSLARALNPAGARAQIIGVFHPTYLPTHQDLALRLAQPRSVLFKGGGGEGQRNPEKPVASRVVRDREAGEEIWPAMIAGRLYPWRDEPLDPSRVEALWHGDWLAEAPIAAVIGTAALALKLLGLAASQAEALTAAVTLWDQRHSRSLAIRSRISEATPGTHPIGPA